MNVFKKITALLIFITINSCAAQEEKQNNLEIIYKAQTRGSSYQISYVNHKIDFKNNSIEKTITLKAEDIKIISTLVSKINLDKIQTLIAPSSNSSSDRAMIAFFFIKVNKEAFTSSNFDHENPPQELNLLYQKLKTLIK